jgi:hypothetical protein
MPCAKFRWVDSLRQKQPAIFCTWKQTGDHWLIHMLSTEVQPSEPYNGLLSSAGGRGGGPEAHRCIGL